MAVSMSVLETDRLTLRRLTVGDAPFMLDLLNQPSFLRFIGDRGVRSLEAARGYIARGPLASYERHGFGLYLVVLQTTGDALGICGLLQRDFLDAPDIGFAFLPRFWSQGYAFEAASAVLAYGRNALGIGRILAITAPDNTASIRLLEKLGLRFQGLVKTSADGPQDKLFGSVA